MVGPYASGEKRLWVCELGDPQEAVWGAYRMREGLGWLWE